MKVHETQNIKSLSSSKYNYIFDKKDGFFVRWGKNLEDDPLFSPYGPEILDIEIGTSCHGSGKACSWCYKSNTPTGKNMSLETFAALLDKLPRTVTQVAFGIGDIDGNPDLFRIMEYSRNMGIIPNITINGWRMTNEYYDKLADVLGACAVSHYNDDTCFNAVEKLSKAGLKQVNIHQILSRETLPDCYRLLAASQNDSRLKKNLKAIVFLAMKPKGKRNTLHSVTLQDYKDLLEVAILNEVSIGFDSCSAPMVLKSIGDKNPIISQSIEPCESFGLFSAYINVNGDYFPCSFAEGVLDWKEGISVVNCKDFLADIWNSSKLAQWRKISLATTERCDCKFKANCRKCPIFDITLCDGKT